MNLKVMRSYYGCSAPFYVEYNGHWTGRDRQVWTSYSQPFRTMEEAYEFYKTVPAPKSIHEKISENYYCCKNIEVWLKEKLNKKSIQQEFDFEWE